MKQLRVSFFVALLLICLPLWADTWSDPGWKEMLSKSDIIGLFEVQEGNAYKARLKPVELYKGKLKDDHIWYTGYSNRYGPFDSLNAGEKYILFLQSPKKYKSRFKSATSMKNDHVDSLYKAYDFVRSRANGYSAWSPTAGEVYVEGEKAYYGLTDTGFSYTEFHRNQTEGQSLTRFTEFLKAHVKKSLRPKLKEQIIADIHSTINASPESPELSELIMMLYYLDNHTAYDVLLEIPYINNIAAQFALTKQLEKLNGKEKDTIEKALLKSPFTLIRAEVVKQISSKKSEKYGPVLVQQLTQASDSAFYANIMSPNQENRASELVTIIDKLKEMDYKKAIPPLLETMSSTADKYTFYAAAEALDHFENREYYPLVVERIENPNGISLYDLEDLISKNQISLSKKPLMALVTAEAKEKNDFFQQQQNKLSAIKCLSVFKGDTEVEQFVINQLDVLTNDVAVRASRSTNDFIKRYIETLTTLESRKAQKVIHQALFYWFGLNANFSEERILNAKTASEKEISAKLDNFLNDPLNRKTYAHAFITNTTELRQGIDTSPKMKFIYTIQILNNKLDFEALSNVVGDEKKKLINEFDIDPQNLGFTTGGKLYGMDERFSRGVNITFFNEYLKYARSFGTEEDITMLNLFETTLFDPKDKYASRKLSEARYELNQLLEKR